MSVNYVGDGDGLRTTPPPLGTGTSMLTMTTSGFISAAKSQSLSSDTAIQTTAAPPPAHASLSQGWDPSAATSSNPPPDSGLNGQFSAKTETTARYVGLGIFGLLALTVVIILINWGIHRCLSVQRKRRLKKESSPFPIQEPTFPILLEKPASHDSSREIKHFERANRQDYDIDAYMFGQSVPRPPLATLPPLPMQSRARTRSSTSGDGAALKYHKRPAPLELKEISHSSSANFSSTGPVLYNHSGQHISKTSLASDPFQERYSLSLSGSLPHSPLSPQPISIQHHAYIPPVAPISPFFHPSLPGEGFSRLKDGHLI